MAKKLVATRLPIGTDRKGIEKSIEILNEEFGGKIECKLELNKVLIINYDEDVPVSDLISLGLYIGRNVVIKS